MLEYLVNSLRVSGVFERQRTDDETRAMGILLYHLGLSLRDTSLVLERRRSHEAVREWYQRASKLFDVVRRRRRAVAVDETKIRVQGRWRYLWAAIDVDNWEVLAVWVTEGRSSLETRIFLRLVLRRCEGVPRVYVDRAPWYPWALNSLGIPWEHRTFGERNPVEQWFGILKHRIKRFYRRWPQNAGLSSAELWVQCFVSCYHIKRLSEGLS